MNLSTATRLFAIAITTTTLVHSFSNPLAAKHANYFSPSRTNQRESTTSLNMGVIDSLKNFFGFAGQYVNAAKFPEPCVMGDESIMSPKAHGTSETPVQSDLRWKCDWKTADRICNFNRHFAEYRGYWLTTTFTKEAQEEYLKNGEIKFYDSNTGKPLFVAPKGRTFEDFMNESQSHGWPSFRDEEVVWENVRCLPNGEVVSVDGTHLGHNLPDFGGSRHCINVVSVAGRPVEGTETLAENEESVKANNEESAKAEA